MNNKFKFLVILIALVIALFVNIHAQADNYQYMCYVSYRYPETIVGVTSEPYYTNDIQECFDLVDYHYHLWSPTFTSYEWEYYLTRQETNNSNGDGFFYGNITYQVSNTQAKRK